MKDKQSMRYLKLLREVMRYRRGLGKYNFSKLPENERAMAALEAWEKLESKIENAIPTL